VPDVLYVFMSAVWRLISVGFNLTKKSFYALLGVNECCAHDF
jgi:hypothetical protein